MIIFSDEPKTISIAQAIKLAKRAIAENRPDYLEGYLALNDSIVDLIESAKPPTPSDVEPLKKVWNDISNN